jgi:hypothetical protein
MISNLDSFGKLFRIGFWSLASVALVVALSGCAKWNLRGQGFHENELSKSAQQARSQNGGKKKDIEYSSVTEKGRQIERDLGSQ